MRALTQRVSRAKVAIGGKTVGEIDKGLVILLGVCQEDTEKEADFLAEKVANLRIMADSQGKMNLSIKDIGGEILVVSQFTLYADASGGRRPSFIKAANPELAKRLYERFIEKLEELGVAKIETGRFGEYMEVEIINDGPVTMMLDTEDLIL